MVNENNLKIALQAFKDLGIDYTKPMFQESLERAAKRAKDLDDGLMSYGTFMATLYLNNINLEVKPNPRGAANINRLKETIICQYDGETGKLLRVFNNVKEAAKYMVTREDSLNLNAAESGIRRCISGRLKTYKNYRWKKATKVNEVYRND